MADIHVFGTPAVDLILRVHALPAPGDHIGGILEGRRTGGSSANLACGLASAGHHVRMIGPIGDDPAADAVTADLRAQGVDTHYLIRRRAPTPEALILIDDDGERAIIGLAHGAPDTEPLTLPALPDLPGTDLIYIESYLKYPTSLAAQAPSALIAVPPPDRHAPAGPAHLVIGSTQQLPPSWADNPHRHARTDFGNDLRWVIITNGPNGATAHSADKTIHVPAQPAHQIDATGAGDAFAAGLLHGLLTGKPIEAALTTSAAWGAAAVEHRASIPPRYADVFSHAATDSLPHR
jgi:sugar/nucleoside kinase (ribokinase family)